MYDIKTKKGIELRKLKLSDLKPYFEIQQDEITKKGFMTTPKTLKEAKEELEILIKKTNKRNPSNISLAINYQNSFAGVVAIYTRNDVPLIQKGVEGFVSYSIHPNFRGKGLATYALKKMTEYVFKEYDLKRISGKCRIYNKASARVLEKAGFKLEAIHKKQAYIDGKYYDNMLWVKLN